MASTLFFLFALAASAAARPSNSNMSSVVFKNLVLTEPGDHFDDKIDQNSPYILDDMRFVDWQLDEAKATGTPNLQLRWPGGVVYYFIDPASLLQSRFLIRQAMEHITTMTAGCIKFIDLVLPPLLPINCVKIFSDRGCYSNVGMVGGQQTLSLGPGCLFIGTIVHELCHAIGLFHEQNRSDRDIYVTVNEANIKEGFKSQFDKLRADQEMTSMNYDYSSIMHYGSLAFSSNKEPTITPNTPGITLQEPFDKKGLTQMDTDMIKRMYGC